MICTASIRQLKRRVLIGYVLLTLAAIPACVAQISDSQKDVGQHTVHLQVSLPARPQAISPLLFGSFLEPIGHSTYGGLWADVIENPSFEDGLWSAGNVEAMLQEDPTLRRSSELGLPLPWHPLDPRQGNRFLIIRGDAANSNQSLLMMGLPDAPVGVWQQVYLSVQRTLSYNGSLMVKHVRGATALNISLRRHNSPEEVLASTEVNASAETWTNYPFHLQLQTGQVQPLDPVDLVIALKGEARAEIDNVSLMPSDALDGLDPDEVSMAKDLHSPVVRFGGNFTSAYDWHHGVGPRNKRLSTINPSWGIPEYNTFGTDEFLHFCRLVGAEPQIALNLGTGTPEQAAEWVRYVDDHWNAGKGGLLWELGNELWGNWQIGYPRLEQVGAVTEATSHAVRSVDPRAKLIATGADEDSFEKWNAEQYKLPDGSFNYISTHFVVEDHVQMPNAPAGFRIQAALALPWGLGPQMHATEAQAKSSGHSEVQVAFTEWLMVSPEQNGLHFNNMGGGLFAGGFLNMLMRNSDAIGVSDMTGIMEFGGIWKRRGVVYGTPAYWALRDYSSARPALLLDLQNDSPTYDVSHGITRLPEIKGVPYLDCVATEPATRDMIQLHCVNLHPTRPIDADIDLGSLHRAAGEASVITLKGRTVLEENDEKDPLRVHPVTERIPTGASLHHTFPSQSVTLITIPVKKQ